MDYNFIGKKSNESLRLVIHKKVAVDFCYCRGARATTDEQPVGCEEGGCEAQRGQGRKGMASSRKERRANGGCLGYPEARKDVVSCDKARGSANRN